MKPEIILGNSGSTNRYPNNPYPNITTAAAAQCSQIITCWQLAGPGGQAHPRHGPRSISRRLHASIQAAVTVLTDLLTHGRHAARSISRTPASRRRRATSPLSSDSSGSQAPKPPRIQPPTSTPSTPTSPAAEPSAQASNVHVATSPGRARQPGAEAPRPQSYAVLLLPSRLGSGH